MPSNVSKFFTYRHLPVHLQAISRPIGELAELLEQALPSGPEKSAGMRKLLEAKDCFVRAALEGQAPTVNDSARLSLLLDSICGAGADLNDDALAKSIIKHAKSFKGDTLTREELVKIIDLTLNGGEPVFNTEGPDDYGQAGEASETAMQATGTSGAAIAEERHI